MSLSQHGIDTTMLESLQSLLGANFDVLLSTYLNDSNKRIERLEAALETKDFSLINEEAHGLKGSSRNIGAVDLADVCEILETKGREQDQDGLEQLFASVQQKFAVLTEGLQQYR